MTIINALNLFAGIGGNRKSWPENVQVTAVEWDENRARAYRHFFPKDKVIVSDAHEFLLHHFDDYDFIWSIPPCPTHSKVRWARLGWNGVQAVYPDMALWQEIILLQYHKKYGKWVIENVQGYYDPLIPGQDAGRHRFWANFLIPPLELPAVGIGQTKGQRARLEQTYGFTLEGLDYLPDKTLVLRNCVDPRVGFHVFCAAYPGECKGYQI